LILLESNDGRIVLNYKGKTLHKERNDWLVLTRTSVAGFNAPRDNLTNRIYNNVDPVLRQAVDRITTGDWL
jgi:hypothetical protein